MLSGRWIRYHVSRRSLALGMGFILTVLAGCGAKGDDAARASDVPRRAGDVWELDSTTSRATAPAAMLAYANGLHALVLDGSDVYAGMTRLRATRTDDGAWMLQLPGGIDARLTPRGDSMVLAFSSGEQVGMHKRQGEDR